MGRLDDKVAIVTGGASGIGRAAAELMAAEGARVVVSDIDDAGGAETVTAIEAAGGRAVYLQHDVRDEQAWERVIMDCQQRYGALTVLVNNAGIGGGGGPVDEMSLEQWRRVTGINLEGVFLGVKHGIRAMKKHGRPGSIVNISSIAGKIGLPNAAAYCASKGGVALLTKTAALECAQGAPQIRVNSVHPGFIDTPLVQNGIEASPDRRLAAFIAMSQPTGEMGRPDDIARGILYLASDESRFMTGSELVIDGGYTAR